jgi:hypothetical protein
MIGRGEQGETGDQGEPGDTGEQGERGPTGDHGQTGDVGETGPAGKDAAGIGRKLAAVGFVVVVVGVVLGYGVQQNTNANKRDECLAGISARTVQALDEAASLTSQVGAAARAQAQAASDRDAALAAVLTAILAPEGTLTEDEGRVLFETYLATTNAAQMAAQAYVDLSTDLAAVRREHPVPAAEEVSACIGGGG